MILLLMIYLSIFLAAVVGSVVVVIVFPLFGATKDKTRDIKDLVRTSLRLSFGTFARLSEKAQDNISKRAAVEKEKGDF